MRFEEILENIGVFGWYQQRLYFALCIRSFCSAMVTLTHVFLAGESNHWCNAPELDIVNCTRWSLDEHQCVEAKKSVSIPPSNADNFLYENENCFRYNLTGIEPDDWYPGWVTSDVTNDTMDCDAGWVYDTSQFKSTIITDFDLVCEKKSLPDLAQSMYFVGVLIGSTIMGAMSDQYGRYRLYLVASILGTCSIFMSALSNSYIMFIIVRACIGATFFSCNVVAFTLISEIVSPAWRTFVGNLLNFFWAGGYMLAAGLGYFIRGWRILVFVVTIFPVMMLFLIPLLSESPRWLISKGRIKEADKIIRKIAKVNKKDLPEEFFSSLELQELNKPEEKHGQQASVIDIFRHPYLRFKTILLLFIWFITTLVYYGLSLSAGDLGVDFYVSFFVSGAVEIPAYLYVMFALDWFGRKPNLSGSLIVGGVACLISIIVPAGAWQTTVAMIGKFSITITFAIVFIFTTEQFPTLVRNVGLGICSALGRLGSIISPIIFIIGEYWEPLPYVVFGALSIVAGLAALVLPETKGKNLPETIEEGEQFGKKQKSTTKKSHEKEIRTKESEEQGVQTADVGIQIPEDNPAFMPD